MSDPNTKEVATTAARQLTPAERFKSLVHSKQVTEQMVASVMDNDPQTVRRICAYVANAAMKTPALFDCTKQSIVKAMLQCCAFGIEPNGWDAHILPYGKEATLVIDYKGFITLALKSERVSNIRAELVCENDEFDYYNGRVSHRVNFFKPRGNIVGAYAVATYKDGTEQSAVLSKEEIDKVRNLSRARNAAAWTTHYGEMAKKTAVRRLAKMLPLSHAAVAAIQHDDETNYTLEPQAPRAVAKADPDALAAALAGGDVELDATPPEQEAAGKATVAPADGEFTMEE